MKKLLLVIFFCVFILADMYNKRDIEKIEKSTELIAPKQDVINFITLAP